MPLWKIYCPPDAYSDDDKRVLSNRITDIYANFLPRFYVNVIFLPVAERDFFIGGELAGDFVRIVVDHIARSIDEPSNQKIFIERSIAAVKPFVGDRGFRWELHVDNTPFHLWTIQGYRPPPPGTPAEAKWRIENMPSPHDEMT